MASDFVADEVLHVELTSRIAMELGGGAPYVVDFEDLRRRPAPELTARQRANELIVHVCCVGEAFSLPMLASERARLADVAIETIAQLSPLWQRLSSRVVDGITTEGFLLEHVRELGWTESSAYATRARQAITKDVAAPLARFGIELPADRLSVLLR